MTDCPSCNRYVGPYDACPYCGAAISGRTSVRALKITALALAVGGLALLWLLATQTDVPSVEIGQANALMNLAYVRVKGRVSRPPSYDLETGYLSFWLQEDKDELRVAAYQNESQALIAGGRVPALGDWVTVEGTLRIREDFISLTLNVPEKLEIDRPKPVTCSIGDITAADALTRVRVRGEVRDVRVPYPGLTLVGLRDGRSEIELAVSEVITTLSGNLPALAAGQTVEVVAPVSLYKDTPQLSLADTADLTVLEANLSNTPVLSIGPIGAERAGEWVTVEGKVTDVSPFSAGVKYTLDDGTGRITLLVWQSLYDQMTDSDALAAGALLRVQGEIAEYRGDLEIVPELPLDVRLLAAAPEVTVLQATPTTTPAPQATPTPTSTPPPAIGDVTAERLGETVALRGIVRGAESFSGGFKFTLDDGTGQITLLTWLDVYDGIAGREGLRIGASVQITGEIGQFEKELQIVPPDAAGVTILEAGSGAALRREIGTLSSTDVGNWVAVEGQVVRVEEFSNGVRAYINDGSGEILTLLWNNVYERIPDNTSLITIGNRLRVAGQIEEYQGQLEIVPMLPFDIGVVP